MTLFSLSNSKCFWGTSIALAFYLSFLYIVNSSTLQTPSPNPCKDPYKQLRLILNPNGTVTRSNKPPESPPAPDPNLNILVLSKDLTINQSKGTWARIYLPRKALDHSSKLPLVVFFHGGGFIFLSAASTIFHDFCFNMANDVVAVVASIEYRLAPEHRLPAAYEDAMEALHWITTNRTDDWVRNYVDYYNVFLMGSSAGGNIAYNAGLRAASGDDQISKIRGLILVQPFFGGTLRTASELRLANEPHLSLCTNDMLWELSLPVGVDRDYEYCNPTVGDGPVRLEKIRRLGWWILVTGCGGDPLVDRQMGLVRLMEKKGVRVVGHFTEGDYHGVQDVDPLKAKQLYAVMKSFISSLPSRG
ncbi:carboxylesterase 1-like [Gastrolobium bilobum]|uniref:carboxylesterase 1-like n=1 Tax=Gastrolobium bilobum TaxID=150636 RepID=UPI002AB143F8|nr:carboxylesterase 1-like [Gastrolobium bilobum]